MKKKKPKEKGKMKFKIAFQELKPGDIVAISRNLSEKANFHKRMGGRTGTVQSKRGRAYIIKIKDHNETKTMILNPIHIKKI